MPTRLPAPPATDPTPVYRHRDGLYAPDLVTAGLVWLDVFSWLDRQPSTSRLCARLGMHARPADVMVTLFAAMGLVVRDGDTIRLTPLGREHFVPDSPYSLGASYASFRARPVCRDLVEVLHTDKPARLASTKPTDWLTAMLNPAFADGFTAAMDARGLYLGPAAAAALDLAGRRGLLDIAGGSGIYACAFVDRHPHLSATVFERPPVDAVAARAIAGAASPTGSASHAGDMLRDPLPRGHDVHLISNVLTTRILPRSTVSSRQLRRAAARRTAGHPRRPLERREDRTAAGRRLLGDADARHGRPLLQSRRDAQADVGGRFPRPGVRQKTAGDRSLVTARKPA